MPFPPTLRARGGSNFYPCDRTRQLSPTHPGVTVGSCCPPFPWGTLFPLGNHTNTLSPSPLPFNSTPSCAPSPCLSLDLLPMLFLAFGGIFLTLLRLLLLTMEIYCVLCAWKMNFHVRRGEQLSQAREIKLGL